MKPTVGRIVYYVGADQEYHASIITKVWADECVSLHVLHPDGGATDCSSVFFEERGHTVGTWHWPPRNG